MEKSRKSILFLGGGRSNIGAVKAAKKLGYRVIVAGQPGDYMCYELADKIISVNIMDKEAVLNSIRDENFDGVLTCCSDRAIDVVGCINDKYDLSGVTENSAKKCNNKYLMKECLIDANVSTPIFVKINDAKDLKLANSLRYPLIIKAVDLQSSNGVYKCCDFNELVENYQRVLSLTKKGYCIVEEFVEGIEIGAQAFIRNGKVLFVLPHGYILIGREGATAPIIHYSPIDVSSKVKSSINLICEDAIKAIGYDNCAVNIDLILKDDQPYILELTGRVGANCLPELVSVYYGFCYYDLIVSTAVGDNYVNHSFTRSNKDTVLTRMIISDISGKIASMHINDLNVEYISMFVKKGDCINKFRNSNDCIGELLVVGRNLNDCFKKSDEIIDTLNISVSNH